MKSIKLVSLATFFALVLTFQHFAFAEVESPKFSTPPKYTSGQATQGKAVYDQYCGVTCHGGDLKSGFGPPLVGDAFYGVWGGRSVAELLQYLEAEMPVGAPGILSNEQYRQVLAYMFQVTGIPAGSEELSSDPDQLDVTHLPIPPGGLFPEEIVDIPPPPNPRANPLDKITKVTDGMLAKSPVEDWLMWRRTYDAHGFSPLKQITTDNVNDLKVVWTWTMPSGRNISTPLVHDGVLFMYGAGSMVYAFDAETGDLLWRYERKNKSSSTRYFGPRAISIYADRIILTADDGNIVALDVKTGTVAWDRSVLSSTTLWFSGGPLIVDEKILLGTATASAPGKNFILALDAHTGDEIWRFYTIPQDGELGGDSWNGISEEERQGSSIWVPASYDPESKLVFFGTGNTYRPSLLRELAEGASSNDGLFTNSTLAFDVDTGKLAWHFQHLRNDQWNYDWSFERTIMSLPVNGTNKKVVVTGGKQAIFEAMQVSNGAYQFSIETGLQNVITSIDPKTGAKSISPDAMIDIDKTTFVCPDSLGNRNWQPTSFNPETNILFTPFRESCMKIRTPLRPNYERHDDFGQRPFPRPDSDGNFGGLRAVNLESRETLWTVRRRATFGSGVLATAGGLVFFGTRDRVFSAHHQLDGRELWRIRLNGVPSGAPISFMVAGKQYIAITTGDSSGFGHYHFGENGQNPNTNKATIWVFELRDSRS